MKKSFHESLTYFPTTIGGGRALEMCVLTGKYKDIPRKKENIAKDGILFYRTSKLKARLETHFGDSIVFANKRSTGLQDVINIVPVYKQSISDENPPYLRKR